MGFQLENLLAGESPFTMPEPVFKSPRNLMRMLGQKVKRNWHQPATVVVSRTATAQTNAEVIVLTIPAQTGVDVFGLFVPFSEGITFSQSEFVSFQSVTITSMGPFVKTSGGGTLFLMDWAFNVDPVLYQIQISDGSSLSNFNAPHGAAVVPAAGVNGMYLSGSFNPSTWDSPQLIITIVK